MYLFNPSSRGLSFEGLQSDSSSHPQAKVGVFGPLGEKGFLVNKKSLRN